MLGIEQYKKIQKLKKIGLSKVKVSQQTNLSYKTICNYWNMNENYFINKLKEHEFILVNYRQYIIEILKICPQINNTVLIKRIKEDFPDLEVPHASFHRYIKKVREETGLVKPERKYKVREETLEAQEGQVDFGQYVLKTMYGRNVRIYFFCMTLSYSRMKFAYFSVTPFTCETTIDAHRYAFRYFGGRPNMLVYDQDKTMVVSENLGDVIFVKEFEEFIKEIGFSVYVCKGYDPETKGKVEKSVDFIKRQFLDGRVYYGIDQLNAEFLDWLDGEGNGMINETTKKSPRELFKKEYKKLIKVKEKRNEDVVIHTVFHDTVEYKDNLYKLPASKVNEGDRIRIERQGDTLVFYFALTGELLCKHRLATNVGHIITLPEEVKEDASIEEVLLSIYKDSRIGKLFLHKMREQKPRYVYPQCRRLNHMRKHYTDDVLVDAMKYCINKNVCTVFELTCYLLYKYGESIGKKYIPKHTYNTYLIRSSVIKEELENGNE